jgi:hypothetical protein
MTISAKDFRIEIKRHRSRQLKSRKNNQLFKLKRQVFLLKRLQKKKKKKKNKVKLQALQVFSILINLLGT